jgi:hypothetical protein
MLHRYAALLLALVLLAACGDDVIFEPAGPGATDPTSPAEPPSTAEAPDPDAIWFEVLGVTEASAGAGADLGIELIESPEELAARWDEHDFEGTAPDVSFDEHVAALIRRGDNACPDEVVEVRQVEGVLEHTLLPPPGPCTDPYIVWAYAIAYHRSDLGEELTIRISEYDGPDGELTATFTLPPYEGEPAPAPSPPPRQMDDDELDTVFADHPVRRCSELPDPRQEFLNRDRPAPGHTPAPLDESVPGDVQGPYAAEHAETFGWLMVLQDEGVWVIGVTDDTDGHRERLQARHPDATFRIDQTPHAQRELAAAQQAVLPLHGADEGPELVHSSYFAYLELGIIDPTREDLDASAEVVDPALVCVEPALSGIQRSAVGGDGT